MKWQTLARRSIRRLSDSVTLTYDEQSQITILLSNNYADELFGCLQCKASESNARFGWNKMWQGNSLYGWWGRIVTIEPLRLTTLEIVNDDDDDSDGDADGDGDEKEVIYSIRRLLQFLYNGRSDVHIVNCVDRVHIRPLLEFAVQPTAPLAPAGLNLLRRLNLDRRECPHIERWHWSGASGIAYLSDGGRLQITRELAWTRALEAAMDETGSLPKELLQTIYSQNNNELDIVFPQTASAAFRKMSAKLAFFGLVQIIKDGLRLVVPVSDNIKRIANLLIFN